MRYEVLISLLQKRNPSNEKLSEGRKEKKKDTTPGKKWAAFPLARRQQKQGLAIATFYVMFRMRKTLPLGGHDLHKKACEHFAIVSPKPKAFKEG